MTTTQNSSMAWVRGASLAVMLLLTQARAWGQSTIAYFNGPVFQIPSQGGSACMDLDRDGVGDVSFSGGPGICTDDVPPSECDWPYYATPSSTNRILCQSAQALILPAGILIGSATPTNGLWGDPGQSSPLATYFTSARFGVSGWRGPLGTAGDGYLGIQFYSSDGLHYGWIHARLPNIPLEFAPVIEEWAYETRPNMPILSDAVPLAPLAAPRIVRPGNLRLNWQSQAGQPYQVQFKDQVDAPCWSNLDLTIIASATNTLADIPIVGTARFYRVIQVP